MKKILHIVIALSVICSIILVPVDWSAKAGGNNKRDDLIKSVSFYNSNGKNVTAKENYNEKLNYFLEVAFGGILSKKGTILILLYHLMPYSIQRKPMI